MRFQIYNPKGKIYVKDKGYFLLHEKPLKPNREVWNEFALGFRVIPDKPIDEDEYGHIYSFPRQIVIDAEFLCEFATDPDWQIRTIYKE